MRTVWLFIAAAFCGLFLAGCASSPPWPDELTPEMISGVAESREPARPWPQAATAKLFILVFEEGKPDLQPAGPWPEGRLLTRAERANIEGAMELVVWKQQPARTMCCLPHHFVRYYDAAGKQIGEIAICFCCGCVRESPSLSGEDMGILEFDYERMKAVMTDMGVPTDVDCRAPE